MNPNTLLWLIFALMLLSATFLGLLVVIKNRQYALEAAKYGDAVPLFKYLLAQLGAYLMHPHEWAAEADALIRKALKEPLERMPDDEWALLRTKMIERTTSTSPDLRPFEREYAAMFLLAMSFARREAIDPEALGSFRLIGTQAPVEQTAKEKNASSV